MAMHAAGPGKVLQSGIYQLGLCPPAQHDALERP
jgi:hypothetical protein